jgi:hypothetical protein
MTTVQAKKNPIFVFQCGTANSAAHSTPEPGFTTTTTLNIFTMQKRNLSVKYYCLALWAENYTIAKVVSHPLIHNRILSKICIGCTRRHNFLMALELFSCQKPYWIIA